ncbi:MAG: hypothetical protein U0992_00565 [Planctomycetaceae bacterium]
MSGVAVNSAARLRLGTGADDGLAADEDGTGFGAGRDHLGGEAHGEDEAGFDGPVAPGAVGGDSPEEDAAFAELLFDERGGLLRIVPACEDANGGVVAFAELDVGEALGADAREGFGGELAKHGDGRIGQRFEDEAGDFGVTELDQARWEEAAAHRGRGVG